MVNKLKKLNQLVEYAVNNNDFYREYYRQLVLPVSKIETIPLLKRNDIRNHMEKIISMPFAVEDLEHDVTNGTTEGNRLSLYKSKKECAFLGSELWRNRNANKKHKSINYALYYSAGRGLISNRTVRRFGNNCKCILLPIYKKNINEFREDLRILKQEKISLLIGSPSILYTLAKVATLTNEQISIPNIETQSEYLPLIYRHFIEDVFGAQVRVQYGCHEVWGIAYEHDRMKMRIMESVILETIENTEFLNGFKRCVVTSLCLKSMPIIRYELNDLIKIQDNNIVTYGFRYSDYVFVNGTQIHCSFFSNLFHNINFIKLEPLENYQLLYNDKKITLVLVKVDSHFYQELKRSVIKGILKSFGIQVHVDIYESERFFIDLKSSKMRGIIHYDNVNWYNKEYFVQYQKIKTSY